jgi:hypothetical protein
MSVVSVRTWWRRFGVTRPARGGHRSLVAGVLVLGLGALAVGVTVGSGALAVLGIVLAVPQTVEAGRNLRDARRSDGAGFDRRRALARRMLAVRRAEEMAPSIPGGAVIDLDYLPETELVTFRSQDDRVATFDELVTAIEDTGGPLVLVGAPGAGKTFTARWVVTTLLDRAVVDDGPLAERFLLSRWDGSPLTDWLPREWARRREYRLGVAEAADLIADPSVVLVLDGLDEVPNAQRQACVDAINAFVDVHPRVRVVVCCRNREYRGLAQRIESRRAALGRAGEAAQALLPADMDEYDGRRLRARRAGAGSRAAGHLCRGSVPEPVPAMQRAGFRPRGATDQTPAGTRGLARDPSVRERAAEPGSGTAHSHLLRGNDGGTLGDARSRRGHRRSPGRR